MNINRNKKTACLLLVFTILVSFVWVVAKYSVHQYFLQQKEAITRVDMLGGSVVPSEGETFLLPSFLCTLLGEAPEREIYGVVLRGPVTKTAEYRSNGLLALSRFQRIRVVDAENTDLVDDSLVFLESINSLWGINFEGTKVTRQGVDRFLKKQPETEVRLPDSKVINVRLWSSKYK